MSKRFSKGFTLIELLVVIGILGILLAIVLIAINPAAQFAQANNTARTNDVNTILNAIHQYAADHRGLLPPGMPAAGTTEEISTAAADICSVLVPDYVSLLPVDPDTTGYTGATQGAAVGDCAVAGGYTTNYDVLVDTSGRVTVSAPGAESVRGVAPVISVTR